MANANTFNFDDNYLASSLKFEFTWNGGTTALRLCPAKRTASSAIAASSSSASEAQSIKFHRWARGN